MGSSPTVKSLQDQNQEFNTYIQQATTNLKTRSQGDADRFESETNKFYADQKWDKQLLGSGEHYDYKQADEFSIAGLEQTVKSIASAVFGQRPAPAGSTIVKDTEAAVKAVASLVSWEALAVNAALAFVSSLISAFDTSAVAQYTSTINRQSLAQGLTLHVWSMTDSFRSADYFNNSFIVENIFAYKLIYSFAEAATQQDIDYFNQHEVLIKKVEDVIQNLQDQYDARLTDPNATDKELDGFEKRIDRAKALVNTYRKEMDDVKKKYAPPLSYARAHAALVTGSMDLDFDTSGYEYNNISYRTDLKSPAAIGICCAMSANWLKNVLRRGHKLSSTSDMADANAIAAQQVVLNRGNNDSPGNWVVKLQAYNNLVMDLKETGKPGDDYTKYVEASDKAYFFYIRGNDAAHAMAFWGGTVFFAFFDPNFGQYSCIRRSTFSSFVRNLVSKTYPSCDLGWLLWEVKPS
jgi:Yersinia/Haemophilus virulence surface antigen